MIQSRKVIKGVHPRAELALKHNLDYIQDKDLIILESFLTSSAAFPVRATG